MEDEDRLSLDSEDVILDEDDELPDEPSFGVQAVKVSAKAIIRRSETTFFIFGLLMK